MSSAISAGPIANVTRRGLSAIARGSWDFRTLRAADPSGGDPALAAEVVRLSNRTALLTFATAFAVIAALVALPTALSAATVLARLAAVVPIIAAAVALFAVRRARMMLRAARGRAGGDKT